MTDTGTALKVSRLATFEDRQRRWDFDFDVAPGISRILIDFRFAPGEHRGFRNLITLALLGPHGFRGAAHRWQPTQDIVIGANTATAGFIPGLIEPGEWRCSIDLHEILNGSDAPCRIDLSVSIVEATADEMPDSSDSPPEPHVASASRSGWIDGDLHSHSVHSDGSASVLEMADAAIEAGLDFLAITAHNTTSVFYDLADWPESLLAVRGFELTTFRGHLGILGLHRMIDWNAERPSAMSGILKTVRDRGGLAIANHPCAQSNPVCTGCRWDFGFGDVSLLDAIEIWNGTWDHWEPRNPCALTLWDDLLNDGHRITATAGSDAHSPSAYRGVSPFNALYVDAFSEASVLQAIRAGRVILSSGPHIQTFDVTDGIRREILPGTEVLPGAREAVEVLISGLEQDATVWMVWDGGKVVAARSSSSDIARLVEIPVFDKWLRWEVRAGTEGTGEMLALTNPVFVGADT